MAASSKLYGSALVKMGSKEIDLTSDPIMVSLHTSSYTPDQHTHDYQDDLTNEVGGTAVSGYVAGGTAIGSCSLAYGSANKTVVFDGLDVNWVGTMTARYAVVYAALGTVTSANPLICYADFGVDKSITGGTLTHSWGTAGIFSITVA